MPVKNPTSLPVRWQASLCAGGILGQSVHEFAIVSRSRRVRQFSEIASFVAKMAAQYSFMVGDVRHQNEFIYAQCAHLDSPNIGCRVFSPSIPRVHNCVVSGKSTLGDRLCFLFELG